MAGTSKTACWSFGGATSNNFFEAYKMRLHWGRKRRPNSLAICTTAAMVLVAMALDGCVSAPPRAPSAPIDISQRLAVMEATWPVSPTLTHAQILLRDWSEFHWVCERGATSDLLGLQVTGRPDRAAAYHLIAADQRPLGNAAPHSESVTKELAGIALHGTTQQNAAVCAALWVRELGRGSGRLWHWYAATDHAPEINRSIVAAAIASKESSLVDSSAWVELYLREIRRNRDVRELDPGVLKTSDGYTLEMSASGLTSFTRLR